MHNNLGNTRKDQGRLDEATDCYRLALELKPDYAEAHSNLVYTQLFFPVQCRGRFSRSTASGTGGTPRPWNHPCEPHANDRSPSDGCGSAMSRPTSASTARRSYRAAFLPPTTTNFQIFCYADVARPTRHHAPLRSLADGWRNIAGMDHQQVAEQVRRDESTSSST